ncbi:MAG TPA: maleylacetoacetate isomerase [Bdellovibrionota bacterium]|jgi:maleylacetoacetate isomerase
MGNEITLYHYWRSSASWRVRWGLEIKKVPHQKIAVDLLTSQEKNQDYLKRNPAGYVPCLIAGKNPPLGESLAILHWLEENYPKPSFFTGDSFLRARICQLAETVNAGIQPLQNLDVTKKISDDKEKQAEWTRHWIQRGMQVYENILSSIDRKGCKFSVSDQPTLADLCLIPQCYSTLRFGVDLKQFPQCKAIYEHALATPECKASAPEAFQPK